MYVSCQMSVQGKSASLTRNCLTVKIANIYTKRKQGFLKQMNLWFYLLVIILAIVLT